MLAAREQGSAGGARPHVPLILAEETRCATAALAIAGSHTYRDPAQSCEPTRAECYRWDARRAATIVRLLQRGNERIYSSSRSLTASSEASIRIICCGRPR